MSRLLTKSVLTAIVSAVLFSAVAHAGDKNDKDSRKKNHDHNSVSGLVHEVIDWSKDKKEPTNTGIVLHHPIDWSKIGHDHNCDKPNTPPVNTTSDNGPIVLPGTIPVQPAPKPVIRDHRTEGKVIRDHRTNAGSNAAGGVTVGSSGTTAAGGVVVTNTNTTVPGKTKNPPLPTIPPRPAPTTVPAWGSGAIVRDHRGTGKPNDVIGVGPGPGDVIDGIGGAVGGVVGAIGSIFGPGTITGVGGDSKPATDYHIGPTVRDHRTNPAPTTGGPIIRDHRS